MPTLTTRTGLTVAAALKRGGNELDERLTDDKMQRLELTLHRVCPQWNYTLQPRTGHACCDLAPEKRIPC